MSALPPSEGGGARDADRETLTRMLIAIVWVPFQLIASLIFATGGIFLLLVLGIALSPLIGTYVLVRCLTGGRGNADATTDAARRPTLPRDLARRLLRWGRPARPDGD